MTQRANKHARQTIFSCVTMLALAFSSLFLAHRPLFHLDGSMSSRNFEPSTWPHKRRKPTIVPTFGSFGSPVRVKLTGSHGTLVDAGTWLQRGLLLPFRLAMGTRLCAEECVVGAHLWPKPWSVTATSYRAAGAGLRTRHRAISATPGLGNICSLLTADFACEV